MAQNHNLLDIPTGLNALFAKLTWPIADGPLKGARWAFKSGGKLLRALKGTYEVGQTQAFVREIREGDCVFDVGSHVGWYTLLSSRLVGKSGKVIAFEASPRNYWYLRQHIAVNPGTENVTALHLGIADKAGVLCFQAGSGTGTGHLVTEKQADTIEVATQSLDQLATDNQWTPTHIKIDVEGAEMLVLKGAETLLTTHHPLLFLSTHGDAIKAECVAYLSSLGYQFETMDNETFEEAEDFICRYAG